MQAFGRLELNYRTTRFGRAETVVAPPAHEGLGNALRRAYVPRQAELPREFEMLLEKLA